MVTRVQLRLFQGSTNASVVSPGSDRSVAHRIITFCNRSDAIPKMGTLERSVERLNRSLKTEQNVSVIKSHTVRMYVCMYVRMYVCTYVCMYVCMYVYMYACTL